MFSASALPGYFEAPRSRNRLGTLAGHHHVAFLLRGPMDVLSERGELQFCREALHLGLTGISLIRVGASGVISERVAYNLSMASEQLRQFQIG
jgi:hypothetical protein